MAASDDNWASALPSQVGQAQLQGIDESSDDAEPHPSHKKRDSFRQLSLENRETHHAPALPLFLVIFVAILALLSGFLVAGMHKAIVYSGCPLGINGCNELNRYYAKYGFKLNQALDGIPEEVIYIVSAVLGACLCGQIIAWLPEHLSTQLTASGTPQALVAVATGDVIPFRAALLRIAVSVLFLASGGSLGAEGPAIQVCTSLVMMVGWAVGIRSAVTQSLLASLGFSCGFAASFNAPVAGIVFAMEELQHVSTRLNQSTIYIIILASIVSTSVSRLAASNSTLFHANWTQETIDGVAGGSIQQVYGYHMWLLISVPIGIICSLAGYVVSSGCNILRRKLGERVQRLPLSMVLGMQALLTASVGAAVFRYTGLRGVWGIGAESLQKIFDRKLKEGFTGVHFLFFALGKAIALVLGIFVRAAADILEPVLMTGGFIGGAVGTLLPEDPLVGGSDALTPCVIFGMVGLFASCFRFPLTPVVIVLELTGVESYAIILPAALCAFTAVTCSNWCFPALLDDVLLQEGIDLELLAKEAEEQFTEHEREKLAQQDETEKSEEDTAENSPAAGAARSGRPRFASEHSNQSSFYLVIRDLENSLLAQSRSHGSPSRSHASSSPTSSRRPSNECRSSRRPSNASSRQASKNPAPSLVGSRRPSDASMSSRGVSKGLASSIIVSRRPSNPSMYSLPPYQRVDLQDQSTSFEVPMQSLASQNGMPGGAVNLRLAVRQDPNSVEPAFLLEVQPHDQFGAVCPRSPGSKPKPAFLKGHTPCSSWNLDEKIESGFVLEGVQEGRPCENSTVSKESECSQHEADNLASDLPGSVDVGRSPDHQSAQHASDNPPSSIQLPACADRAAASAFSALHAAERLAGACTEQAQEHVLQPMMPPTSAQAAVLRPMPAAFVPLGELHERPAESMNLSE
eukprot:TRINITY_DN2674_c0_g3_i1.p1 TRINITY_DN2674_c0_g3~~TRINITY_DN2674_c0_g3_i1.p1  ORF type:complete len:917 (-),score=142.30 TRINITY_DN2674_c0_g3_i1:232-2982(-)